MEEEENAATLQLGQEFQLRQINHQGEEEELIALNLSEARLVIKEALIERRRAFKRSQKKHKRKHMKHESANDETTAVEEDDEDLDEDDADEDDFMHSETREKELELSLIHI